MARHVVTASAAASGGNPPLVKGQVVELTASEETALSSSLRATTARDLTGENTAVSN